MMNTFRYEDIRIGMEEGFSLEVTREQMDLFRTMSGDENPLHRDPAFAEGLGHRDTVVFGMLTASFLSTLAGVYLPGKYSLIRRVETEFPRPVYPGERLSVKGTVTQKNDDFRFFEMRVEIRNQDGLKVCRGKMQVGFTQ